MNRNHSFLIQALLFCVTVIFAVTMLYIKSTDSAEVMYRGVEARRNLTLEDLAKTLWEDTDGKGQ